ncbi:Glycosyl transferase family 2 [Butyrivibrio sp. ob235]|uniref:glycosyltransferase family 2 protein n=1 Tax=Butyrivibrio sp. ob235 TaxID=1761780 RepID=UPI0008BDD76B|nr:glycosyltransferase family A protein [Butyrivibrio sp. ob235]SEL73445.1 Glycosyl transferase family 2 [Butyrivibrio sp. ob235]
MVSVIIPAYNAEKYIEKCLESVCDQTYKDLQIIVVDDGSKDNTLQLIKQKEQNDSRITVIQKANGGVSSARNMALSLAKGEYVFFLDADDMIELEALETLVSYAGDKNADFVSCQYSRWDDTGKRLDDFNFLSGEFELSSDGARMDFVTGKLLPYHVGYEVWDKLYKNEIIRNNKLLFSEECKIGEDLAFNIKYLICAVKVVCVPDRCIRYVIHEDSAMGGLNDFSKKINESVLVLEDIWQYASDTENKEVIDSFPLVCTKVLENTYYDKTPEEVVEAYKNVSEKKFVIDRYKDVKRSKDSVLKSYSDGIGKLKYRFHMYVLAGMQGFPWPDRLKMTLYDIYRKVRHRQILKEWKMTY